MSMTAAVEAHVNTQGAALSSARRHSVALDTRAHTFVRMSAQYK